MTDDFLYNRVLILDGAMGTMLQAEGLKPGEIPERFNILHPEIVKKIHLMYIESGANIITANTFGASPLKLSGTGLTTEEVIRSGLAAARSAAGKKALVALDIGPCGEMLKPLGSLSAADAYGYFKRQVICGVNEGADIILIETMTDLQEAKLACLAAKENSSLPVFCTMSFEENGRTFTGCTASAAALTLSPLADAVGVNCSVGPDKLISIIKDFMKYTSVPVIAKPNAGLPQICGGEVKYDLAPAQFCSCMGELVKMGVSVIGGCCGTTPEHIQSLSAEFANTPVKYRSYSPAAAVCTSTKTVTLNEVRVIGERINPTGKKRFKQALVENDTDYIIEQAVSQINAGADILDVNTGLPEIDEKTVLPAVINEIQAVTDCPLQIDSSDPIALEAALRAYVGKPIVNSVNGEDKSINAVLPLVKKYGAAVVALTLDENGIPKKSDDRLKIVEKLVAAADKYGISRNDLLIDCLTLTVSAQQEDALETLKAVRMVKERYGLKTVLGVSNISFGLPCREYMNESFLAQALAFGLDLPIINPNSEGMMRQIRCHNVIANVDKNADKYIKAYSAAVAETSESQQADDIISVVVGGFKDKAYGITKKMLDAMPALEIVDNHLIPALDIVGDRYEKGTMFLPQLIRSAETVKRAFECIKETMPAESKINKGTVIIATVKGDIHDIGKNIVKVIMENYGFCVIDLGKDVAPENVLAAVKENNATLVGLSALMTTTVKSMEQTVKLLHDNIVDVKVMVGGAVLNNDYAMMIGADYYASDAKASVEIARKHFNCE